MVYVSDISFAVRSFKIITITPMKIIIRVRLEDADSQTAGYADTDKIDGVNFVCDLILEAGKYGATIIPYMSKSKYGIGLNLSYYHNASEDFGILGLEDAQIPSVLGAISGSFAIPLTLALNSNKNHITGFHGVKTTTLAQDADSIDTFLASTRLRDISDFQNDQELFGVFSKPYYLRDGSDMSLITDKTGVVDTNAFGGEYTNITSATNTTTYSNLPHGAYLAFCRYKVDASTSASFRVAVNSSSKFMWARLQGNYSSNNHTASNLGYEVLVLPFYVNSDDNHQIYIQEVSGNNLHLDVVGIIPLSDRNAGVIDLMLQNLTINNGEFVGVVN